jgi:hypothetical protein
MDDENRQFTQANDSHSSSINEALKKRQGSTERTRIQRPRSQKGNRGLQSSSNSTSHIPKIAHTRSEERNLRSQGGQRNASSHNSANKRNIVGSSSNSGLLPDSGTLAKNYNFVQ